MQATLRLKTLGMVQLEIWDISIIGLLLDLTDVQLAWENTTYYGYALWKLSRLQCLKRMAVMVQHYWLAPILLIKKPMRCGDSNPKYLWVKSLFQA